MQAHLERDPQAVLLHADHQQLEIQLERLLDEYDEGTTAEIRQQWRVVEDSILEHLRVEEETLVPLLQKTNPLEAGRILRDHTHFRVTLAALTACVDLHLVGRSIAEDLIFSLRDHAMREEKFLYPLAAR